jgi:hypothetical protein
MTLPPEEHLAMFLEEIFLFFITGKGAGGYRNYS